jgi:hypothetical protein
VTLMVVFFIKSDYQIFCRTVKAPTAGSLNRSVACGKWRSRCEKGTAESRASSARMQITRNRVLAS